MARSASNSTLRVGTEFRVYLPAMDDQAVASMPMPVKPVSKSLTLRPGSGKVMIVDDEVHIRRVAASILKRCGYQVYECDNGETAVRTYEQMSRTHQPLDVVLMDLTLKGGMEGLEASRAIWKFDPGARIIVSSGSVTDDVQRTFLDKGFFAILPKPYEAGELSEAIYTAVTTQDVLTHV